jgi:hypothetical protein
MNNYDATVAERRAAFWDRIKKHQPIADEHFFGDEWRALTETRTMEAAKAAAFQVYLVRLSVSDESDEASNLDEMQMQTSSVMHDLRRKVAA